MNLIDEIENKLAFTLYNLFNKILKNSLSFERLFLVPSLVVVIITGKNFSTNALMCMSLRETERLPFRGNPADISEHNKYY